MISYEDLENRHFVIPKRLSPFYIGIKRIPRKLKKKYRPITSRKFLDNDEKMWYILGMESPNYMRFIIKLIIKHHENLDIGNI